MRLQNAGDDEGEVDYWEEVTSEDGTVWFYNHTTQEYAAALPDSFSTAPIDAIDQTTFADKNTTLEPTRSTPQDGEEQGTQGITTSGKNKLHVRLIHIGGVVAAKRVPRRVGGCMLFRPSPPPPCALLQRTCRNCCGRS